MAIDEVQLAANLPSLIKYLYDTYSVKFIITGSSSYYLKSTFSESLAGRKRIFEMYLLSFKELMVFKEAGQVTLINTSGNPTGQPAILPTQIRTGG